MTEAEAELVAIRALGWLAGQDDLWPGFLSATGVAVADLRTAAAEPGFLAAVLDHLAQSDAWVTAFCAAENLPATAPMAARRALPGGAEWHWT